MNKLRKSQGTKKKKSDSPPLSLHSGKVLKCQERYKWLTEKFIGVLIAGKLWQLQLLSTMETEQHNGKH